MQGSKHKPTEETRAQVEALKSYGHTNVEVAEYLGICEATLHQHYSREVATAVTRANAAVAGRLYAKAVEQDELGAQIFWLKTRGKWKEEKDQDKEEKILEEMMKLREELAAKNKKEY
jgi:DNA-binding CsgD family transcriptional regulator